jgi:hypothetical protein
VGKQEEEEDYHHGGERMRQPDGQPPGWVCQGQKIWRIPRVAYGEGDEEERHDERHPVLRPAPGDYAADTAADQHLDNISSNEEGSVAAEGEAQLVERLHPL